MRKEIVLLWPLFLPHNFFVFHFLAKRILEFRENMMFFRIALKSSNYNYLSRRSRKVLFSRHRKWWVNFEMIRLLHPSQRNYCRNNSHDYRAVNNMISTYTHTYSDCLHIFWQALPNPSSALSAKGPIGWHHKLFRFPPTLCKWLISVQR